MSKYINYVEVFGDTIVMSTKQKEPLAKIYYFPHWRQYVLEPLPESVFNDECLESIIKQIKLLNKKRVKPSKKDAINPICRKCEYWVNMPVGCTLSGECPQNPFVKGTEA